MRDMEEPAARDKGLDSASAEEAPRRDSIVKSLQLNARQDSVLSTGADGLLRVAVGWLLPVQFKCGRRVCQALKCSCSAASNTTSRGVCGARVWATNTFCLVFILGTSKPLRGCGLSLLAVPLRGRSGRLGVIARKPWEGDGRFGGAGAGDGAVPSRHK